MDLNFRKLTPMFGVEVNGADIAQSLDDSLFSTLHSAWLEANGVMVVRKQRLSPEQHIEFGRRFGDLYSYEGRAVAPYALPGHPQIYRVSNKIVDDKPQGRKDAGTYWHSDQSYDERPPSASILYALEIPPVGGDTLFADLYRAYSALSEPMKKLLEPLRAVHSLAAASRTSYGKDLNNNAEFAASAMALQPIVRTHPDTGRKALFINPGFTAQIEGLTKAESSAILDFLFTHIASPEFCYRHTWQPNDVVIWDNRSTVHYAVSDYDGIGERLMHRVTVIGDQAA